VCVVATCANMTKRALELEEFKYKRPVTCKARGQFRPAQCCSALGGELTKLFSYGSSQLLYKNILTTGVTITLFVYFEPTIRDRESNRRRQAEQARDASISPRMTDTNIHTQYSIIESSVDYIHA
jgi:hypothetical protein